MLTAVSARPRPAGQFSADRYVVKAPVVVCGVADARADQDVARFAADLVKRLGGQLILLNIQPPKLIEAEPQIAYAVPQAKPADNQLTTARGLARLALATGVAPWTEIRVGRGDPEQRLIETASQEDATLIVVGLRTGSSGRLRGRFAARVIRRAACPVVVVPVAGASDRGPSRSGEEMTTSILCGVDGSRNSRVALRLTAQLAGRLGVRLVVAHVVQPPIPSSGFGGFTVRHFPAIPVDSLLASGRARLEQILSEEHLSHVERRVLFGFVPERLSYIAQEERSELIVVGSRGRGPFKAALLGSVSTDLIGAARCPVLVVPPGAVTRTEWRPTPAGSSESRSRRGYDVPLEASVALFPEITTTLSCS